METKIKRLRIFGHSNGNYVALSRFEEGPMGKVYNTPSDLIPGCKKRALSADILGIGSNEVYYYGGNEQELSKLCGKFSTNGLVELHACYIAPGFGGDLSQEKINHDPYGLYLMKALARLWKVRVMGGSAKQNPEIGLEGEVFTVYPDGRVERKKPDKKKHRIPTMKQDCQAGNMLSDSPYRDSAITPNSLARGAVSSHQPILGVG